MTSKSDVVKRSKGREDQASKMYDLALTGIQASRKGVLHFAAAMQNIRDNELWLELNYDSFNALCASPEIALMPATVEKYIRLYDYWIGEKKMKIDTLAGIGINKLEYIQDVDNPSKYLEEAKTLPFKDFKKLVDEKEYGTIPNDDIVKHDSKCPHWDGEKCTKKGGLI